MHKVRFSIKYKVGSIWNSNLRQYASSILIATLISRMLGYIREVLMAVYFGTSIATDAWLMASVLPNLLFGSLYGAVSNLVIPLYLEAKNSQKRQYANRFIQEIFTLLTAVALLLSVIAYFCTPIIVHGFAPGFAGAQYHLTVTMTRIMLPTFVFWLWAGLFSALLQALNLYGPPAWAPVLLNIIRILFIITLSRVIGIEGVAWGFTAGVGLQLLVLFWVLSKNTINFKFRLSLQHPLMKKFIRLVNPVILASLMGSLGIIVDRIFASELEIGTIAALNYSYLIIQLPIGLIVLPIITPLFTSLSQKIVQCRYKEWSNLLSKSLWLLGTVMAIITLIIIILSNPIIGLIYQHGAFGHQSTLLTSEILPYFAIGLITMALSSLLLKALVSLQYTSSLSIWTMVATGTNILADFLLVHPLQGRGLALGTSLANIVYAVGLAFSLRRAIKLRMRNIHQSNVSIS
ncbi:MAG: murein biosynthesis integral membrane protein MurJ [Acidibacillus sp.]|nr:murein biosynthesis integral membrane protein MurJ [Acidibacillus sp.]